MLAKISTLLILILTFINLLIPVNCHGKLKKEYYSFQKLNFISDLVAVIITLIVYYFTGMFDWILK